MPVSYNVPPTLHAAMVKAEPQGNLTGVSVHEQLMEVQTDKQIDNLLVNSSFEVAQDGTSFTGAGYTVDQWVLGVAGSTVSLNRSEFTVGQTVIPNNPKYYLRTVVTSVTGSANSTSINQKIESVLTLNNKQAILSFWAKADSTKNIAIDVWQNFGTGGSPSENVWVLKTLIPLASTWTKYYLPMSFPSLYGKVLGTSNNDYVGIRFWFDAGSDSSTYASSLGQQSGTFDIACPKLEAGTVATPWVREDPSVNWARCLRFYYKISGASPILVGQAFGATVGFVVRMPMPMRASPSVDAYNINCCSAGGASYLMSSLWLNGFALDTAYLYGTVANMVMGNACLLIPADTGFIKFNARL